MNQQLYPTVEAQPHGVPGLLYREHGGVGGGENRVPAGLDGNTLAQLSAGENGVGHVFECHCLAL